MSVVAVKKYEKYIEICADGLSIKGAYNIGQQEKESCKLHTDDNNYIMGSVGYPSDGKLFNYLLKKNKDIKLSKETPIDLSGAYELLKEFQKKMSEFVIFKNLETFDERMNYSCFVLVVNDSIFMIYPTGINEIKEFNAIGAGQDEVLSDLINGLSPTEAVVKSAKSNIYISEPITTYRYYLKTGKIEKIA